MSVWRAIYAASAVTLIVTIMISVLPRIEVRESAGRSDQAVFRSSPLTGLSSNNLVDSIVSLKLQLKPIKVDWRGAVLSVDLSVEQAEDDAEAWANDMQRLLHMAFLQASNVKRVLIRYMEPMREDALRGLDGGNRAAAMRLLAAADVRRSDDWLLTELDHLSDGNPFTDPVWRGRLRLSFSDFGSSRLQ